MHKCVRGNGWTQRRRTQHFLADQLGAGTARVHLLAFDALFLLQHVRKNSEKNKQKFFLVSLTRWTLANAIVIAQICWTRARWTVNPVNTCARFASVWAIVRVLILFFKLNFEKSFYFEKIIHCCNFQILKIYLNKFK